MADNPLLRLDDRISEALAKELVSWNIMVYLAGDNNLAEEMVYALKSMYSIGSTKQCRIFAFYEGLRSVSLEIPYRMNIVQGPRISHREIQNQDMFRGPVSENHEIFAAAEKKLIEPKNVHTVQATLERFIQESVLTAPAHHYMLILSGHGTGDVGDFLAACKRPCGLSIPDLSETLANVEDWFADHKAAPLYHKLDILGLDSCQMSTAEVACQIAEHVDYMVGSEGFQPNTGWPYDKMLARLNRRILEETALRTYCSLSKLDKFSRDTVNEVQVGAAQAAIKNDFPVINFDAFSFVDLLEEAQEAREKNAYERSAVSDPFPRPVDLAAGIVREHIKFYCSDYSLADVSTDMSALNLQKFDALSELLKTLARKLVSAMGKESVMHAVILAHWYAQGYKDEQNIDLWDFCNCLITQIQAIPDKLYEADEICDTCEKIKSAIEAKEPAKGLVVLSGYCGPAFQHSHGLSIYFPWTHFTDAADIRDLAHYRMLDFANQTKWGDFLDEYLGKTKKPVRGGETKATHASTLNRRDFLYTIDPEEAGLLDNTLELDIPKGAELIFKVAGYAEGEATLSHAGLKGDVEVSLDKETSLDIMDSMIVEPKERSALSILANKKIRTELIKGAEFQGFGTKLSVRQSPGGDTVMVRDGHLTVRDGRLTARDGRLTVRDGRLTVRDGHLTVRDGRLTVRDGHLTVRGGETEAGGSRLMVRDGRLTVRDGRLTVRGGFQVRSGGGLTVRGGGAFGDGTVRNSGGASRGGGAGLPTKIASMKNPPVRWNDCDLMIEEKKSSS